MIVVDIGNTNIVIGVYSHKKLTLTLRLKTNEKKLLQKLHQNFKLRKINSLNLDYNNCIISSVSSLSTNEIIKFFKKLKFSILNINTSNIPKKIKFKYTLNQLGADRIANTFAAINKYKKNILVVDFGTATTFDIILNNIYEGGLITSGINISHDALVFHASKLNKVSIVKTNKLIGKNTNDSMQSGFYWGYVSLINGIINKIIKEKKIRPKIILTGGLAKTFEDEIKYKTFYEPNLTLEGLYLIGILKYA
jgi:type III pantothenate kinase